MAREELEYGVYIVNWRTSEKASVVGGGEAKEEQNVSAKDDLY